MIKGSALRASKGPPTASVRTKTRPKMNTIDVGPTPSPCIVVSPHRLRLLRVSNLAMATFHGALSVLTLTIGNIGISVPAFATNIKFLAGNETTTDLPFELQPSYTMLPVGIPFTWIVFAFFLCSCFAHLGNATVWRSVYESEIGCCRVPTRWIEYFVSASLMMLLIAYTAGVREYTLLIAIAGLTASTMPFGWFTEQVATVRTPSSWELPLRRRLLPHVIGYVPQTFAWMCVLLSLIDEDDKDRAPPWVLGIVCAELALFWSFGLVQLGQQLSMPINYFYGEVAYHVLSLTAKGALGGVMLVNILIYDTFEEAFD